MPKRHRDEAEEGDDESDSPRKIPRLSPTTTTSAPATNTLLYTTPSPSKPPPFQQPLPLLTFSYTPSRTLEFTNSAMRYFVDPPRGADLGYGYERWVRRPEERGRVDGLLKAWERIRTGGALGGSEVGVVAWRGVITKILTAPYEMRDGWELNVMYLERTMYFEEHLSFAKIKEKNDMDPHHRVQSYYGYAFESWCTSGTPVQPTNREPEAGGWGGDVDTNVQWCSVVKTKLGGTRMVIGGEVDCVRGKYTGQTNTFVELKTSLTIRGPHDESKFEKKLLKFYFQSFLLGVPEILVGFRTPKGILTTLQSFKTMEIPRLVRGKAGSWDPGVCLSWGERFLEFLKGIVAESPAAVPSSPLSPVERVEDKDSSEPEKDDNKGNEESPRVWRVVFTPGKGVSVRVLDKEEVEDVKGGEDRVGFLPRWFWDAAKEGQNRASSSPANPTRQPVKAVAPAGWQL